jgi:hypothetical protein
VPVLGSSPVHHLPFALHLNPKNVLYRKVSSFRLFKILFLDQILGSRWQAIQGIEQIYESGAETPDLFNSKTTSRPFLLHSAA